MDKSNEKLIEFRNKQAERNIPEQIAQAKLEAEMAKQQAEASKV